MSASPTVLRVFLSSTAADLAVCREKVDHAIRELNQYPVVMETFGARPNPPAAECKALAAGADVLVVLVAYRYGYVPPVECGGDGKRSITWLEVVAAREAGRKVFAFVIDPKARWSLPKDSDRLNLEPEERFRDVIRDVRGLRAFKAYLEKHFVVRRFETEDELARYVVIALSNFVVGGKASSKADELSRLRRAYVQRRAEKFERIDCRILTPRGGTELPRIHLDDVFIPPLVVRGASTVEAYELERVGISQGHETYDSWGNAVTRRRYDDASAVSVAEALRSRRVVLLGSGGTGKTTLLKYLARTAVPNPEHAQLPWTGLLPVYVRLDYFANYLARNAEATLTDYLPVYARMEGLDLPSELIKSEAEKGNCLFLLDGFDQITNYAWRAEVRDRVQELAFERRADASKIVITSRGGDYSEFQFEAEFEHFTLTPLRDDAVARFAEDWCRATGRAGAANGPPRQDANTLVREINGNVRVRRMAGNPLLLTLIAILNREDRSLPRRRIDLYYEATRAIIRSARVRAGTDDPDEGEIRALLPSLAYLLHGNATAGPADGAKLGELLGRGLREARPDLSAAEAEREAERLSALVREHRALLSACGWYDRENDTVGFEHVTFQEYFAGLELVRVWRTRGDGLAKKLHLYHWHEPILLAAVQLAGEDLESTAVAFVREILGADTPYEKQLRVNLLLAAQCVADAGLRDAELIQALVEGIDSAFSGSIIPLNERITEALCAMVQSGSEAAAKAYELLLRKSHDPNSYVRRAVATALGRMPETYAAESVAALDRLAADPKGHVRRAAEAARQRLQRSAETEPEKTVQLDDLSVDLDYTDTWLAHPEATISVEKHLEYLSRDDPATRRASAEALGRLGVAAAREPVLDRLAAITDSKEEQGTSVEDAAYIALSRLVPLYLAGQ